MSSKKQCKPPKERIGRLLKDGDRKCEIPCDKLKSPEKSKRCQKQANIRRFDLNKDKVKNLHLMVRLERRIEGIEDIIIEKNKKRATKKNKEDIDELIKELKKLRNQYEEATKKYCTNKMKIVMDDFITGKKTLDSDSD